MDEVTDSVEPICVIGEIIEEQFREYQAHGMALKYAELKARGSSITTEYFYSQYASAYLDFEKRLQGKK